MNYAYEFKFAYLNSTLYRKAVGGGGGGDSVKRMSIRGCAADAWVDYSVGLYIHGSQIHAFRPIFAVLVYCWVANSQLFAPSFRR